MTSLDEEMQIIINPEISVYDIDDFLDVGQSMYLAMSEIQGHFDESRFSSRAESLTFQLVWWAFRPANFKVEMDHTIQCEKITKISSRVGPQIPFSAYPPETQKYLLGIKERHRQFMRELRAYRDFI